MNKKEVLEIRKQFTPENCAITRIAGCYVNHDKEKKMEKTEAFLSLPEEQAFKYFDIFKKTLSGNIGKNLLNLEYAIDAARNGDSDGEAHWMLMELRKSKLTDSNLLDAFYDKIIESYDCAENYYIVLIHAAYDVPGKTSWAVFIGNPRDLGYEEQGFDLPELNVNQIIVDGDEPTMNTLTLTQRRQARKESIGLRCSTAADLVNDSEEQWLVWCDLNDESSLLHSMIDESVEVKGSDKPEHKKDSMLSFSDGNIKALVTKPKIAGFGMNWQNCHNMIFVGLSDSYEAYYQAVRRCWRFGQGKPVNVYIIISAKEGCVKDNIEQKQKKDEQMKSRMIELTKEITKKELRKTCRISTPYDAEKEMQLPKWEEFN